MKFAVFVVLSCLFILVAAKSQTITTWGNVNAREMGTESVEISSSILQQKVYTLSFPKVPMTIPIQGIKHIDFKSHRVSVQFLSGGIGYRNVTIQITSQRGHGINSQFSFYA